MALWVSVTEFQAYLIASGLLKNPVGENDPAGFLPLSDAILASQEEFDRRSGWHPFLWDGSVSTRYFDMNLDSEGRLDLKDGLLRIETVTVAGTEWSVSTAPYVSGMQVFPLPKNAPARNFPYTRLQFAYQIFAYDSLAGRNNVAVTGDWGRVYTLPIDVKMGVMGYASAQMLSVLSLKRAGGALSMKEADEEVKFGANPFGAVRAELMSQFDGAVNHWRQAQLG